jgi:hypothetical protein
MTGIPAEAGQNLVTRKRRGCLRNQELAASDCLHHQVFY